MSEEVEDTLRESHAALAAAETTVQAERAARDQAIRNAISAGMSMYRIAQIVGISQQAVARIRDAG